LQVQRLEDRLEVLIEDQTKRLQRVEQQRPGMLSLPSTRSKWQAETQANLALLRRMHGRLERVREVRDGMLPSGPLIEHLAKQKLRAQDPELVDSWEQARQARRVHEQHLLLQERAKKRAQMRKVPNRAEATRSRFSVLPEDHGDQGDRRCQHGESGRDEACPACHLRSRNDRLASSREASTCSASLSGRDRGAFIQRLRHQGFARAQRRR
jgi:hypothetical protein